MNWFNLVRLRMKFASMPDTMRIGIGLGFGFALTLTLVVLVMIVGFNYMAKIQANLEQITQINNLKTELAHRMKFAQRDRTISMYALAVIEDPFEKDEELRRFDRKGAEWWGAWQALQAMEMNVDEKVLAARINQLSSERNRAVMEAVDYAMSHHGEKVSAYMHRLSLPEQQNLSMTIDGMLNLQQYQTQQAVESANSSHAKARLLLLWLCTLTILSGVLVAVIVLRKVMRQSRELERKALFDDLTGLPNRSMFFERLKQLAFASQSQHIPFTIVMLDLDRFKEVNDFQGHHVGDLLLKHVARTLSNLIRRTDTVARMGGDEFVLLLPETTAGNAEVIVKKVLQTLCQRTNLGGTMVTIECSMGIACYPEHDKDISHLLLKADIAMYAAKRANLGYRTYNAEIEAQAAKNVELQHELRHAIENEQLELFYQPKISHHTASIVGVEALVRWNHPVRGLVAPGEFISLAEDSGLIQPLALWVLQAALRQAVIWHEAGHSMTVAVNLSTRNLLDGDLPVRIAKMLERYHAKPEWLVLEITESAVMAEPQHALETLTKLSKMGILLSLDDFGTGYSSLAYLKKLPVSEIKIDQSFIKDMEIDANDTVIVRSTIALGHNLGMKVAAEGVENLEIWNLLSSLGCDVSQGYFMGRPLSASALDGWLTGTDWATGKMDVARVAPRVDRRINQQKPQ